MSAPKPLGVANLDNCGTVLGDDRGPARWTGNSGGHRPKLRIRDRAYYRSGYVFCVRENP
jgi:hypothetical protein